MKLAALFAAAALVPAALNAAPLASVTIIAPTCEGASRAIVVPMRPDVPPGDSDQPCCAKGCHGGSSRKRFIGCC